MSSDRAMVRKTSPCVLALLAVAVFAVGAAQKVGPDAKGTRFYLGIEPAKQGDYAHRFGRYPLDVGNVWKYRNVYKSCIGTTSAVITVTWSSEVTIRAHVPIPEGTMVLRECTVSDVQYDYPAGTPEEAVAWFKDNIAKPACCHYLIFKSGYVEEIPSWGWDAEKRSLTEKMLERLSHPDDPSWELDLSAFMRGELPKPSGIGFWLWTVQGEEDVRVPFGDISAAVHLLWMANGGGRHRYFKDGIGYVKEWYKHGGSYFEDEEVLVSFKRREPSPPNPPR